MFCRSMFRFPARFGLQCFGCDQVVGLANEGFEFIRGQHVGVGEHHPLVASDVGRGGDAFDLQQFVECFRGAFESDAREPAVRKDHAGEDFAADFEAEVVVAPWHILRYVGEGEAEFADLFHDHQEDDSAGRATFNLRQASARGRGRPRHTSYTWSLASPSTTDTSSCFLPRKMVTFTVSPARCLFMIWARICWLSTFSPSMATIKSPPIMMGVLPR